MQWFEFADVKVVQITASITTIALRDREGGSELFRYEACIV